jgi:uncharacterized protein YqkB
MISESPVYKITAQQIELGKEKHDIYYHEKSCYCTSSYVFTISVVIEWGKKKPVHIQLNR